MVAGPFLRWPGVAFAATHRSEPEGRRRVEKPLRGSLPVQTDLPFLAVSAVWRETGSSLAMTEFRATLPRPQRQANRLAVDRE
jgi:hypothetical protein